MVVRCGYPIADTQWASALFNFGVYYTFGLLHSMDLGTAPARTDSQGRVREKVPKAQVRWYDLEVYIYMR